MLSANDIHALLNLRASSPSVVSVYLELSPGRDHQREFKNVVKEASQNNPLLQGLDPDLARLNAFVDALAPGSDRGLALFSAQRHGFWQAVGLPQTVKSVLRVDAQPFLNPLVNILDQYHRYGVLLLDEERSRLLEVFLGRAVELEEPPLALPKQTRHVRLKSVADRLMAFVRSRGVERVILAAPPELEAPFISHLHGFIQDNLIVDSQMAPGMPVKAAVERVVNGETQSRIVRESVLVYRLLDAVRADGMGVVGLQETLNALHRGQVRMLLLREGLARIGRVCSRCRALALSGRKCVFCGALTEGVFDVIQELAQAALEQNCEVIRILHDRRLDAFGGLGAELRFQNRPAETAAPAPTSKVL